MLYFDNTHNFFSQCAILADFEYVIKKGDKTDEIVCYGKETMSASDLEKNLKEHFGGIFGTMVLQEHS